MAEAREKRKLAAIVSADVQGYSRLMGEDESLTVKTIGAYRKIFQETAEAFGGRIVNAPGDAILAEFPSVVDAVKGSVAVQERIRAENASLAEDRRMVFRMGVNLGDVIEKGPDIYGDGVNIAARVESLAEGGGVCVTGPVFDQVKQKLGFGYAFMGRLVVKNISEPIRVYRVLTDEADAGRTIDETGSVPETGADAGPPCIAVLPFENFSGRREHDYFSLGFAEDLSVDISHFPSLQVISFYTARKIGAESRDVIKEAERLDIDYLLKGNLRRKGDQLRISVQLLDVDSGGILWAERYDESMESLFEIQDDIVARVVSAISNQIDRILLAAARKKPITSLVAYDCWLRGMDQLRRGTPDTDREARKIFRQALDIDPDYSRAYAGISLSYFNDWSCQFWEEYENTEKNAYKYARKAVQLDDTDYIVQLILGRILIYRRRFDQAETHLQRSLALNANDADSLVQIASCMAFLGKGEEAEQLFFKAMRLNPYRNVWYHPYGALAYFVQQRYGACIDTALKGPLTDVWVDLPAFLAAAYAYAGAPEQAGRHLALFIETFQNEISPGHRPAPEEIVDWVTTANPFREEKDRRHLVRGLVLAGLEYDGESAPGVRGDPTAGPPDAAGNRFAQVGDLWELAYKGVSVRLSDLKGFHDLAALLSGPEREVHCTALMGTPASGREAEKVIDDKARRAYEHRIRDLRAEIEEAESMNDLARTETLKEELDQLTEHLAKAVGLGRRTRRVDIPTERARAAVTSRIRSAIRKIESAHHDLGRHLANSVRTGTFCSYTPEKPTRWQV